MPTVNMTDTQWLTAYSEMTAIYLSSVSEDLPNVGQIVVEVDFTANETFTNFLIEVPLAFPNETQFAFPTNAIMAPGSGLTLTLVSATSSPGGAGHGWTISGENTLGTDTSAFFNISYVFARSV